MTDDICECEHDMLKTRVNVLERQIRFVMKVLWTSESTSHNAYLYEKEFWPPEDEEDVDA